MRSRRYRRASLELVETARALRGHATEAETMLWEAIRNNNLGVRFRRQHPVGETILDFYAPKCKLVIEVDGEIHDFRQEEDRGRARQLRKFGYTVMRVRNDEVTGNLDAVVERIRHIVEELTRSGPRIS